MYLKTTTCQLPENGIAGKKKWKDVYLFFYLSDFQLPIPLNKVLRGGIPEEMITGYVIVR